MSETTAATQRSKDAMMAARDALFKKMRAIEYQIEGLDIAIRVLSECEEDDRTKPGTIQQRLQPKERETP